VLSSLLDQFLFLQRLVLVIHRLEKDPAQASSAPYLLHAEGSLRNDQSDPPAVFRYAIFVMGIVTSHYHFFIEMTNEIPE